MASGDCAVQSDLAITSDIQYIWPLVFGACEIERLDNFEFTLTAPNKQVIDVKP